MTSIPTKIQQQRLGTFVNFGFTLQEPDDHVLVLLHDERGIGIFSQAGATSESLQAECSLHLVKCHGWDGCLWSRKNETES